MFSYYFCLVIDGSGSIPLTYGSGSGSRRPKIIVRRIQIRNIDRIVCVAVVIVVVILLVVVVTTIVDVVIAIIVVAVVSVIGIAIIMIIIAHRSSIIIIVILPFRSWEYGEHGFFKSKEFVLFY